MTKHSTVKNLSVYCAFALSLFVLIQAKNIDSDNNGNALTIEWYGNVTANKVKADDSPDPMAHLAELTTIYDQMNGTFFLQGTNFTAESPDSVSWRQSPGFVDTVFYSYENHHSLIIRPDDVWTAIIIQFSLYVNANAEALRHSFVNFEGKKELLVKFYTSIDLIPVNVFIDEMVSLINENIDPRISSWITPNFTTTTVNDQLTAGAALMATVQHFFEYRIAVILCGIPEVTILGDVDDWKDIRQRVEKLREFELNGKNVMATWSTMLGRILDEFIRVKHGQRKDDEFWRQAIRVDTESIYLGCGYGKETYLNGWITTFSAFGRSGKWMGNEKVGEAGWLRIRTDKITPGVVQVPIQIYDEFAKPEQRNYTGAIITGHMGYSVKTDEVTLQPLSGWAMTITGRGPDYLTDKITQNRPAYARMNRRRMKKFGIV